MNAILRRPREFAVALQGLHFILLHQEIEALSVFGDDLRLAILNRGPVELARIHALYAKLLGFFQVIPKFRVKQQRLGRDAANVQTGPAEESIFLNESGLQAILAGANRGGVSRRSAADDGYVVQSFGQWSNPQ